MKNVFFPKKLKITRLQNSISTKNKNKTNGTSIILFKMRINVNKEPQIQTNWG